MNYAHFRKFGHKWKYVYYTVCYLTETKIVIYQKPAKFQSYLYHIAHISMFTDAHLCTVTCLLVVVYNNSYVYTIKQLYSFMDQLKEFSMKWITNLIAQLGSKLTAAEKLTG